MKHLKRGNHSALHLLPKWSRRVRHRGLCHPTNRDHQGARSVPNVGFRNHQLSLQMIRDAWQHRDSRRWHPSIQTTRYDGDRLCTTIMNEVSSMRIRLNQVDAQGPPREGCQQVDMWRTPAMVVGTTIGLIGRPGTEGVLVYRHSNNYIASQ